MPTLLPAQTSSESLKEEAPVFLRLCHALSLIPLLPRCVLLLIWLPWHFNFHLTRPAYIILIIQANLLAATCPPRFLSPRPLEADRVILAPQMSGFRRGVYGLCKSLRGLKVVDVLPSVWRRHFLLEIASSRRSLSPIFIYV